MTQLASEGLDAKLELPGNQNAMVEAVLTANPRTIVVVESGGAVLMPWAGKVPAILQAFYPGSRGRQAIARVLTGKVNPLGHLPITFPASIDQLPHPVMPGSQKSIKGPGQITYSEGAAIGYKWHDVTGKKPLYALGHGLSYTSFATDGLSASVGVSKVKARFTVQNTGQVAGKAVAQVYAGPADWRRLRWEAPKRLVGFVKADLPPGGTRAFELTIDPRLLATYQASGSLWTIRAGQYRIMLGQASDALPQSVEIDLPASSWSARKGAGGTTVAGR